MLRTRIARLIEHHQTELSILLDRAAIAERWELEDQIWRVVAPEMDARTQWHVETDKALREFKRRKRLGQ